MNIDSIDHIEFYVGDIDEWAGDLCGSFGFQVHGRGGPETGLADCRSLLLRQRGISVLLTSALTGEHAAARYVRRHGDGVAVIAVAVADAQVAFAEAVGCGAVPVAPPAELGTGSDRMTCASVDAFGDVVHRFVSRARPGGPFSPGIIEESVPAPAAGAQFEAIDHLAVCVPAGELDPTVRRYQQVFGFSQTFEERILVGSQAMDSKVVQNASRTVTLTIIEPDTTREPGQIDEFVQAHDGAGIQHVAFLTGDIATAVETVSDQGVRFLTTPPSYYDSLPARVGSVGVPLESLRELSILADRDEWGVMLQIFTESRHPRNTFFYELIERRGARSFGSDNIKALYEAVERQRAAERSSSP